MVPLFIALARIVKPHGIAGELAAELLTDFPEQFNKLKWVWLGLTPEDGEAYELQRVKRHNNRLWIKIKGVTNIEQAKALAGRFIQLPLDQLESLPENEFYAHQLLGLKVISDEGENLGLIVDILETGANDVYIIKGEKGELLIPAIKDVILSVELDKGILIVHLLEGLR